MTVLLLALLLYLPTVASAATVCVNTTGTGGCFRTIQQGVDAAASGDTVDVAAGAYVERVVVAKKKRIRLQGAGPTATIIDGKGGGTVLKIKGPNQKMEVAGIGIQHGRRGIAFGELVKIDISDCAITGHTKAGGINGEGAGSVVTVTRCAITGNSSKGSGGGIRLVSSGSSSLPRSRLDVVSSTIRGNAADGTGGGIYVDGKATLTDSSVDDNSALYSGGGISVSGNLTVAGSTISRNKTLGGDAAVTGGGGIDAGDDLVTVRNSTISGNATISGVNASSTTGLGGGLLAQGRVKLEHVTVANNTSDNRGGGIFAGPVSIKASLIGDNAAPTGPDCDTIDLGGSVTAAGANLIEDTTLCPVSGGVLIGGDPKLGPLQNDGGTTETHALVAGSPALGVVTTAALCTAPDQRGKPRAVPCDLGAYEAP